MQHHLIKTCIEFTNKLNPQQVAAVDCSDQPMYALANYPIEISEISVFRVLALY